MLVAGRDTGSFTSIAVLSLSVTAVILGMRHEWMRLSLVTVVAAFATHAAWAIRPLGVPVGMVQGFWLHFLSVSAYYVVFTFASIRFQQRCAGPEAPSIAGLQRSAGRAVGPIALVLYVSFVAWLFHVTIPYEHAIHWFLFPLAALQLGLARFHRRMGSLDAELYLAAGVVFATLSLVAWLDGLTLNLALAAEALLLLILSRSLDLWVLNPFAQLVWWPILFTFGYGCPRDQELADVFGDDGIRLRVFCKGAPGRDVEAWRRWERL